MKRVLFILFVALFLIFPIFAKDGENPRSSLYENSRLLPQGAYSLGMGGVSMSLEGNSFNFFNPSLYWFSNGFNFSAGASFLMNDAKLGDLSDVYYGSVTFPLKDWFKVNLSFSKTSLLLPKLPVSYSNMLKSETSDNYITDIRISFVRAAYFGDTVFSFAITGKYIDQTILGDYRTFSDDDIGSGFGGDLSMLLKFASNNSLSYNFGVSLVDLVAPMDVAMGIYTGAGIQFKHNFLGDAQLNMGVDYLINHKNSNGLHLGVEEWFYNKKFAIRAGYMKNGIDSNIDLSAANVKPIYDPKGQITFGAGLRFGGFEGDFGYALSNDYTGSSLSFGVAYKGKKREKMVYKLTPNIKLYVNHDYFSPNGDGVKDQVRFRIEAQNKQIIRKWEFIIKNEKGEIVKKIKSSNGLPLFVTWAGKDKNGNPVPDGNYFARLMVTDRYGNQGVSNASKVKLSRKNAGVNLIVNPTLFHPQKDTIKFTVTPLETTVIEKTKIVAMIGNKVVHTIKFDGMKDVFEWDGIMNDGHYPKAGDVLSCYAEITDKAGNSAKSMLVNITVGAPVVSKPVGTGSGAVVAGGAGAIPTVSAKKSESLPKLPAIFIAARIRFAPNSFVLDAKAKALLDKIVDKLKKYKGSTVRIEGHTDNVGSRAMNYKLSKRRANVVKNYFIKAGISPSRMVSVGYGPDMPIDTNKTKAGRANNRRVDVIMINR